MSADPVNDYDRPYGIRELLAMCSWREVAAGVVVGLVSLFVVPWCVAIYALALGAGA